MEATLAARQRVRQENKSLAQRITEENAKSFDSSLKRTTAIIRKLKLLAEDTRDAICQELKKVNLTKYVSEVVAALLENKLRAELMPLLLEVACILHQQYAEFQLLFVAAVTRAVLPIRGEPEAERSARTVRRRLLLRLLVDLALVGIVDMLSPDLLAAIAAVPVAAGAAAAAPGPGLPGPPLTKEEREAAVVVFVVRELIKHEHPRDIKEGTQVCVALLVSLLRQADLELLMLQPADLNDAALAARWSAYQAPEMQPLKPEQRAALLATLTAYFSVVSEQLVADFKELRATEKEHHQVLQTRGELTAEQQAHYEKQRKSVEKLQSNLSALCEFLHTEMPALPQDLTVTRIEAEPVHHQPSESSNAVPLYFDDEETRRFYEVVLDPRLQLPAVLFGEAKKDAKEEEEDEKDKDKDKDKDKQGDADSGDKEKDDARDDRDGVGVSVVAAQSGATGAGASSFTKGVDALLLRLQDCVSAELIDKAALEFCYVSSKANRRKLVRTLFNVPRTSLHLLPFYARLVAVLDQCWKDIAPALVSLLEAEFAQIVAKKDQLKIEQKIRNVRFLGELAKFRVCPFPVIFQTLKACIDDFTHHNIDMCCALLESCGNFLYRLQETQMRMSILLDTILRLKNVKHLDNRMDTMVENAYYQCRPPDRPERAIQKQDPPLIRYIRKLVYDDLTPLTVEPVAEKLRKLPDEPAIVSCVLTTLFEVHSGRFGCVPTVACLCAHLLPHRPAIIVRLADMVLEDIRAKLLENNYRQSQQRVVMIKFAGELFNYCVFDAPIVLTLLYMLIGAEPTTASFPDSPTDFFRIRLVCVLLDTCGACFDFAEPQRVSLFALHFQRYILQKKPRPLEVQFMISDLFESLLPRIKLCETIPEVEAQLAQLAPGQKPGAALPWALALSSGKSASTSAAVLSAPRQPSGLKPGERRRSAENQDAEPAASAPASAPAPAVLKKSLPQWETQTPVAPQTSQQPGKSPQQKRGAPAVPAEAAPAASNPALVWQPRSQQAATAQPEPEKPVATPPPTAAVEASQQLEEAEEEEEEQDMSNSSSSDSDSESSDSGSEGSAQSAVDSDDDDTSRSQRQNGAPSADDDAIFQAELKRMMIESADARRQEAKRLQNIDIPAPFSLFGRVTQAAAAPEPGDSEHTTVRVMLKKGSKTITKPLQLPSSSEFVQNALRQAEAQREEQAHIKRRLLLQYSSGLVEDDPEELASRTKPTQKARFELQQAITQKFTINMPPRPGALSEPPPPISGGRGAPANRGGRRS
eukprot:TRINITY_DN3273_c0_g1_i1.p1 TRINITY_DN3273_c0_g1~~TRINITY_DN3273_c0_g1_i1.p1  ORF type:complete len:1281 (-),score=385.32 TRINITY_DN3273_c0_g1_i1:121-3921(-)